MRDERLIKRDAQLSLEVLKKLLDYNPVTGRFVWKPRPAGSAHDQGYVTIHVGKHSHKAHRLAWFFVTGKWPQQVIDHINGDRADNRFDNLRLATFSQNCMNRKRRKDNTSGYKGVCWMKANKKWAGYVYHRVPGNTAVTRTHIGLFTNKEEAHAAVCKRRTELHGEFARHD